MKKSAKKWLLIEAIILAVSILTFTHTTLAYFSSRQKTDATITSGNVTILLSESAVKNDGKGNLVPDPSQDRIQGSKEGTPIDYGIVYPGQTIFKDPTIQNTGSNHAYIAAKISITDGSGDIHRVIGFEDFDEIDISMMFGGGLLNEAAHFGTWNGLKNVTYNDHYAMVQIPNRAEGRYDIYFFVLSPLTQNETVVIYDQIFFAPEFTNQDMMEFRELRVDVIGFGVQTLGFASCYEAMTIALPEHFSDLTFPAP